MTSEDRAHYLASGSGAEPPDHERLDLLREILGEESTWAEPPPEVGAAILAAMREVSPVTTHRALPARRRWPMVAAATVAVAAVLAVGAGLAGVFTSDETQVVAMEGTELEPAASGQAEIRETGSGWWIRIELTNLPAAAEGTYYEGWMWSPEGDGVSIGTFHMRGGDEAVVLWSGVDPADYPSIWITLEDEDGDPSASDRVMMWGRAEP
jgi:hypothetical protein